MTVLSRREARRSRRAGVAICAVATLQLAAFSWRPVADLIMGPLEGRARAMAAQAPRDGYTAILILGGGAAGPPRQANSPQHLDVSSTASRVWLAARLYHAGVAPRIIVSGRSFTTAPGKRLVSEAESVLQDLGVPVDAIVLEARSVNTRENAQESRRLIGDDARVALVTSAYHMPRAMREMRSAGVHTYAFPTDFRIRLEHRPASHQWLPTPGALQLSTLAIKEWLGMLMQSVAATKREAVILRYKRQYVFKAMTAFKGRMELLYGSRQRRLAHRPAGHTTPEASSALVKTVQGAIRAARRARVIQYRSAVPAGSNVRHRRDARRARSGAPSIKSK